MITAEVISYDDPHKDVLYKIELFDELQNEVAETRTDNERLQQIISERDDELSESSEAIRKLQTERESLKRQLEDLQVIFLKKGTRNTEAKIGRLFKKPIFRAAINQLLLQAKRENIKEQLKTVPKKMAQPPKSTTYKKCTILAQFD